METIKEHLKGCETAIRQAETVNFLQKVDFEAERKRICNKIMQTKGNSVSALPNDCVSGGLYRGMKGKQWNKASQPVQMRVPRVDSYKRPVVVSPVMNKQPARYFNGRSETSSVRPASPGRLMNKRTFVAHGNDQRDKSECSRSQFQLSVLKSEKYSIDTRTKKSCAQPIRDSCNNNQSAKEVTPFGSIYARDTHIDPMEDQAKLTVFKSGGSQNLKR